MNLFISRYEHDAISSYRGNFCTLGIGSRAIVQATVGWWLSFAKLWFSLHQHVALVPSKVGALVHQEGNGALFPGKFFGLLFQVKVRVPGHYFWNVFLVNFWDHSMQVNIWRQQGFEAFVHRLLVL